MELEAGLRLVASRARLIIESCELRSTSMLAVNASSSKTKKAIEADESFEGLAISCENSPGDCVVGGNAEKLQKLKEHLAAQKTKSSILEVPVAYHTAALEPILEQLKDLANQLSLSSPSIPVASNVFGRVVSTSEDVFNPEYFARHCRETVKFDQAVESIIDTDDAFTEGQWIEVGPHPALLSMVASRLPGNSAGRLSTLRKDKHPSESMSSLFSSLYSSSTNVEWRRVYETQAEKPALVRIPTMPFNMTEFLAPLRREEAPKEIEGHESTQAAGTPYRFLTKVIEHPSSDSDANAVFDTPIEDLASYIQGHVVCDYALCPASVYQEMALSAAKFLDATDSQDIIYKTTDVSFARPLVYSTGSMNCVRTIIKKKDLATGVRNFEVVSYDTTTGPEKIQTHCQGKIKTQTPSKVLQKLGRKERAFARRKATFLNNTQTQGQQTFSGKTMYERIFTRVVKYASQYRAVHSIKLDEAAEEVLADCRLPSASGDDVFAAHPVLVDTLLHVAGFAANLNVDDDDVCICSDVNSAMVVRKDFGSDRRFEVHCSNFTNSENGTVFADAHAMDSDGIIAVVKGMQFQRAKLSKMSSAFRFANKESGKAPSSPSPPPPERKDRKSSSSEESKSSSTTRVGSPAVDEPPLESGQRSVIELVAETCGVDPSSVTPQTKLEGLGIDSLMIYELEEKLQEALNTQLESGELAKCETVRDVEQLATPAASKSSSPAPKPMINGSPHGKTQRRSRWDRGNTSRKGSGSS